MKKLYGIIKIELALFILTFIMISACRDDSKRINEKQVIPLEEPQNVEQYKRKSPNFNGDSAYALIKKQVDFGPRVPNTNAHDKCAQFLANKFKKYGLNVIIQKGEVRSYTNKRLIIQNIIAQFDPDKDKRIMLCTHWDTRPYADRDTKLRTIPIDGANDGASGVGVLLEIARILAITELKPYIGVDFILFDAEDYGQPQETMMKKKENTWCLGSQYWAKNPPIPGYSPEYGILLDMVGSSDAIFPKEGTSMYYAEQVVNKIWNIADKLGYQDLFIPEVAMGGLTDDHLYINELSQIPCIDIIHYDIKRQDFGFYHHTHKDNLNIIDVNTLNAVGTVVLETIYCER